MPTRLIDGEALWGSKKLRRVPEKFKYHYAHTIVPLAEPNGCFECDPLNIWAKCYVPIDSAITVADVEEMLDIFVKEGMLEQYEVGGKMYAKPVNIDKPGRLPGPAHVARCKNLPPLPPGAIPRANPPIETVLDEKCRAYFGRPEERRTAFAKSAYKDELKRAVDYYGYDALLKSFDLWGESGYSGTHPITAFLKSVNENKVLTPGTSTFVNPFAPESAGGAAISPTRALEDKIALLSDSAVFFRPEQRAALAGLVQAFGEDLLADAFREFYGAQDEFTRKWAASNFIEQAETRCRTILSLREQRARQQQQAEASLAALQEEARRDLEAFDQAEQEGVTDL